jgi:hypothetical protein
MEQHNRNEVNAEDYNAGVSDNKGYPMKMRVMQ